MLSAIWTRRLQYAFIGIVTVSVGFSLYQWNASRAATRLQQSTSVNLSSGLVGYWSLDGDDISGTTAYDRSGSGNNGTLTNGPTRTAGRIGQALNFDGSNDSVSIPDIGAIDFAYNQDFSVGFWSKFPSSQNNTSATNNAIAEKNNGGGRYPYIFRLYNQTGGGNAHKVSFARYDGTNGPTVISSRTFNDNTWHYIVGMKSGSTLSLYVDGNLENTGTDTTTTTTDNNSPLYLGILAGANPLTGSLDEVRVYNRALSANEVRALYDVGNPDKVNTAQGDSLEQGIVGYWKLDDASGTTATDSSGNANNGTLTNGPTWGTGQVNGATVFDGTDDRVTISNDVIGSGAASICAWIYPRSTGGGGFGRIVESADGGGTGKTLLSMQTGPRIGISGTTTLLTTNTISLNTWLHTCATRDASGSGVIYINGARENSGATGTPPSGGTVSYIGNRGFADRAFDGDIDEVRVYNRVLSSEEVGKLYRETAPDNPDTGLVGYWPMNGKDISGTTAYDRSGKGNNGTLTNGPTRTAGRIGQALSFDGVNDYVNGGSSTSLKPSLPISLSYWMKPTTVGSSLGHLSFREDVGHNGYWVTSANDASVSVNYGDDQGCASNYRRTKTSPASVLTANQWQHIVAIIRGATDMSIYVNGTDVGGSYTGIGGALVYDGTSFLRIGSVGGAGGCPASFFTGSLDEVRVYNRALSVTEITTLYEYGK